MNNNRVYQKKSDISEIPIFEKVVEIFRHFVNNSSTLTGTDTVRLQSYAEPAIPCDSSLTGLNVLSPEFHKPLVISSAAEDFWRNRKGR